MQMLRILRRSPASGAAAVLTLALTIGAGASIFAVVQNVLLTSPGLLDPDSLAFAGERPIDQPDSPASGVSYGTFERWRARAGALGALEAFDGTNVTLTGMGAAERLTVNDVTPGFLPLLGVAPVLGRHFTAQEMGAAVVVLGHQFWRDRLASDPGVLGRTLVLGSRPHTVVGVLPEGFAFELNPSHAWRPIPLTSARAPAYRVAVVARLAEGVSPALLEAALQPLSRESLRPADAVVRPLAGVVAARATNALRVLAAAAGLALLVAFTNLAGLLIVRSMDRRRELAVRSALGAQRGEIARQLLLEAQLLVMLGTAGGVMLALWLTPVVGRVVLEPFEALAQRQMAVSWSLVVAVTLAASLCAGVCGLVPAVTASRVDAMAVLRRGATAAPRELLWRRAIVSGEVALAFVLLVCLAMLGGTLRRLLESNPGFDAERLLKMQLSLPPARYATPQQVATFYAALQRAVEERLGTGTVSVVNELPLTNDRGRRMVGDRAGEPGLEAVVREVAREYFGVMRIPVVSGRPFDATDTAAAPPRAIVSASLAARLFPTGSALGRALWLAGADRPAEVIAVVGDVRHRALDETVLPTVYLPADQSPSNSSVVVVRSARPPADVVTAVREEAKKLDPDLPVYGAQPMQDVVRRSPGLPARRMLLAAFTGFALLAVLLAAIGLFGVLAHDVSRRRAELALRIALGADSARLARMTIRYGVSMTAVGLAAGAVLSIWARAALGALGSGAGGLLSFAVPAMVLLTVGALAALPAALQAARTDPLLALRAD